MKHFISKKLGDRGAALNGIAAVLLVMLLTIGCGSLTKSENESNRNLRVQDTEKTSLPQNANNLDEPKPSKPTAAETVNPISAAPQPEALKELVQSTTYDLADAMLTGNFSKAYANMSPDFQQNVSEEQFKDSFMRDLEKTNLTPAVLKQLVKRNLEPKLSEEPYVAKNINVRTNAVSKEVLVVNGKYDTKPKPSSFTYEYYMVDGKWKAKKLLL